MSKIERLLECLYKKIFKRYFYYVKLFYFYIFITLYFDRPSPLILSCFSTLFSPNE